MRITATHTDHELLQRVAAGDQQAFTQLFKQYWDNIYGVAYVMTKSREASKDIVQDVFVKVWLQRTELVHKEDVAGFIFIIARNHIISELRKKQREQSFLDQIVAYFEEQRTPTAEQLLLHKESTELIRAALEELSPQQREIYLLTREKGWRQQEIADYLGISIPTVKTHMSRALAHIREHIARHSGNPVILFISLLRAML